MVVEWLTKVNTAVNDVVWGPIMLALLIGAGLYLSVRSGFLQFSRFGHMIKHTIGSGDDLSHFLRGNYVCRCGW